MIQDIKPHTLYNQYKHVIPEKDDRAVVFDGRNVLISRTEDDTLDTPKCSDIKGEYIYILSIDETRYFLLKNAVECEKEGEVSNYIGLGVNVFKDEAYKNMTKEQKKEIRDKEFKAACIKRSMFCTYDSVAFKHMV